MRVLGFTEPGGPEVMGVHEQPDPRPGAGEVRVRVEAAAVNPSDTGTRSGGFAERYRDVPVPHVPGWDFAGTVDEVGPGVGLAPGTRVMGVTIPVLDGGGAYAELVVVPSANVVPIPDGISTPAAATVPMNALTALLTLELTAPGRGEWIAVTGAAGAYGGSLIQIARSRGLRVIGDAAPADTDLVTGLGADEVVPRGDDVAARIRELEPDGVAVLADGSVQGQPLLAAVRDGGHYAGLRGADLTSERDIALHAVMVSDVVSDPQRVDPGLAEVRALLDTGQLTPRVARTLPAADVAEAHRALEGGGVRGRLVLTF